MTNIISDTNKLFEIKVSITAYSLKIEDKINWFLRKLKKKLSLLSDDIKFYKQLYLTGSGHGILYGAPKIHKPNFSTEFSFHPIFAAYNTASYKLAKFFVTTLSPLTTNDYTIENPYSFVNSISQVNNADKLYMVSFDIENLLTNIPVYETIDICLKYLFPACNIL